MSERPTLDELIAAVREHLTARVIPSVTDAPLRFQTLVAAHVLAVVERELALGPAQQARAWPALNALLAGDEAQPDEGATRQARTTAREQALCDAIEAGRFDAPADAAALRGYLGHRIEDALCIWNPAFLARVTRQSSRDP